MFSRKDVPFAVKVAILRECPLRGLTPRAEREKSQKVSDSHRNDVSPLTQGLRYRAACDTIKTFLNVLTYLGLCVCHSFVSRCIVSVMLCAIVLFLAMRSVFLTVKHHTLSVQKNPYYHKANYYWRNYYNYYCALFENCFNGVLYTSYHGWVTRTLSSWQPLFVAVYLQTLWRPLLPLWVQLYSIVCQTGLSSHL